MNTIKRMNLFLLLATIILASCHKENSAPDQTPQLIFKFKFDSTQARLNNIGQAAAMVSGHAGISPVFNSMSAHYIELAPTATTALGTGKVLYKATETSAGGNAAIDFNKATFAKQGETFFAIPLKDVAPDDYEWLRLSLAYQNYDIWCYIDTTIAGIHIQQEFPATFASFIGFNTFIKTYKIKKQSVEVNANKRQGYWGFEAAPVVAGITYPLTLTGEAPVGATTVVNPLFNSSPIPAGSCVVTAAFAPGKLTITGNEKKDIVIEVSLSTNKSFEWIDVIPDGRWQPAKHESVVDMGIRGMIPKVAY
jgi:hypothetical protein